MAVVTADFTVDAKLLRELGERLVGRPHIALAELIKNSYDADARHVNIEFGASRIVVSDDGHGMSRPAFRDRWMRVGTTYKETARRSPVLGRTLTGSKGVGRLAVQLLARKTEVISSGLELDPGSVAEGWPDPAVLAEPFRAEIDWNKAVQAGDLTSVKVPMYDVQIDGDTFPEASPWGTRIELTGLVDRWTAPRFRRLAQEIWSLQPPYEIADDDPESFKITLTTRVTSIYEQFDQQMRAILDIWDARVIGRLVDIDDGTAVDVRAGALPDRLPRTRDHEDTEWDTSEDGEDDLGPEPESTVADHRVEKQPDKALLVTVQLRDGAERTVRWDIPHCPIDRLDIDLRIFDLRNRQPQNVKVDVARSYLDTFGGVGIYDQHFRLPYYGADQDWLELDVASASRLSTSKLLPQDLQVGRGMQDLPTNRRVFGRVEISTSHERDVAIDGGLPENEALRIQVTRDRLVANEAFERLRVFLRAALDLYAMERARTRLTKVRARRNPAGRTPSESFSEIRNAIGAARTTLPAATFQDLNKAIGAAIEEARAIEDTEREHADILGALATAGMTTIAYDHEISKQIQLVKGLADDLDAMSSAAAGESRAKLEQAATDMREWVGRAASIRQVIEPLTNEEDRTRRKRYPAGQVAAKTATQIKILSLGIPVDADAVPKGLHLPKAPLPSWSAVFQNLYLNAFNAMLTAKNARIVVTGGGTDKTGWIAVEDNGYGIDLAKADQLWEPFARDDRNPPGITAPALGGTGLGLTIVRMITDALRVKARFVPPTKGMSTRIELRWENAGA